MTAAQGVGLWCAIVVASHVTLALRMRVAFRIIPEEQRGYALGAALVWAASLVTFGLAALGVGFVWGRS